ncbi:MAG: hypothetical protein AAF203_00490 [Pseudomonadota bacterium]
MNVVDAETNWLSLSEYSSEYGISVSTLRRRIKGKKIKFKQIHGKYFLPRLETSNTKAFTPVPTPKASVGNSMSEETPFNTAKSVLDELKKAYRQSLQSKEDQIIQLKQQISDLKTLVMYLERENKRLQEDDESLSL